MVWDLFSDVASQARMAGLGGVVGFDYAALPFLFHVHQIPETDWWITLRKLQVVFAVALKYWNKKPDAT